MALKMFEDPAVRAAIVDAFSMGASITLAAYAGGVSRDTIDRWLSQGTKDLTEEVESDYAVFVRDCNAARFRAASVWIGSINTAANGGDWRAGAFALTKAVPEDYGNKSKVEVRHKFNWKDAIAGAIEEDESEGPDGTEDK